jgi:hypothetical protein
VAPFLRTTLVGIDGEDYESVVCEDCYRRLEGDPYFKDVAGRFVPMNDAAVAVLGTELGNLIRGLPGFVGVCTLAHGREDRVEFFVDPAYQAAVWEVLGKYRDGEGNISSRNVPFGTKRVALFTWWT